MKKKGVAKGARDNRGRRNRYWPGLFLKDTAARIGISVSYLSSILAGLRVPSLSVAERMAREFRVEVGELMDTLERARGRARKKSS